MTHTWRGRALGMLLLAMLSGHVCALGLGSIQIGSGLGQPLRASIPLVGAAGDEVLGTCVKSKLQSADGATLGRLLIGIPRGAQAPVLTLRTIQPVNEPVVSIFIEIGCDTRIQRSYQVLLDPLDDSVAQKMPPAVRRVVPPSRQDPWLEAATKLEAAIEIIAKQPRNQVKTRSTGRKNAAADTRPHLGQAVAASSRQRRSGESKNVLRLSRGSLEVEPIGTLGGMQLSDTLSAAPLVVDAEGVSALRAAQSRFAAILRDEDPDKIAEANTNVIQQQIKLLQEEAAQRQQQRAQEKLAFDAWHSQTVHVDWLVAGVALVVGLLLALAWLGWRLYQVNRQNFQQFQAQDFAIDDDIAHDPDLVQAVMENAKTPSQPSNKASATGATSGAGSGKIAIVKSAEMLKVEEISEAMAEAEFWMALKNSAQAIGVLEMYSDVERPSSPLPWLYLLELYRGIGNRAKYESLAIRFKRVFNSKVPLWKREDSGALRGLEEMPELLEQICDVWGRDGLIPFLESILFDNREGQRNGFDVQVYLDIILLTNIAYAVQRPASVKQSVAANRR